MGPSPVILLALEGEEDILPLQSEPLTNYVASFIFCEYILYHSEFVSVSYKTSGTMDITETAKLLYTFDYILNPAEN